MSTTVVGHEAAFDKASGETEVDANDESLGGGGSVTETASRTFSPPRSGGGSAAGAPSQSAAADSGSSNLSLPQLFRKCDFVFNRLDELQGPKLEKAVAETIHNLGMCDGYVKRLALFSKNEEVSDISTSHLKYLLIHYYLAKLYPRVFEREPAKRKAQLQKSIMHATHFLEMCMRFSIMTGAQRERWDAQVKNDAGGGGADREGEEQALVPRGRVAGPAAPGVGGANRGLSREARIAAYKREKELKDFLAAIAEKHGGAVDTEDGGGGAGGDDEDEEELRQMYFAKLELAISEMFNDMGMYEREIEMLNYRLRMETDPTRAHGAQASDPRLRAAADGSGGGGNGNYTGGIEITRISANMEITREKLREGVFKPFHNLPTMELAEFAEAEVANAIEREKRQKEGQKKRVKDYKELLSEGLEDDEELVDAAVYKDRSWDDWKDDNPKGCGLTKKY